MVIKIIVGLGNPGKEYSLTRHNAGFLVVQALADEMQVVFTMERQFEAKVAQATIKGNSVLLVMPQTYMNRSGITVAKILRFYSVAVEGLLVIADDVALSFGTVQFAERGGARGHNGLKSIRDCLQSQNFPRLRIGIGEGIERADHVLSRFSDEEIGALPAIIDEAKKEIIRLFMEK